MRLGANLVPTLAIARDQSTALLERQLPPEANLHGHRFENSDRRSTPANEASAPYGAMKLTPEHWGNQKRPPLAYTWCQCRRRVT